MTKQPVVTQPNVLSNKAADAVEVGDRVVVDPIFGIEIVLEVSNHTITIGGNRKKVKVFLLQTQYRVDLFRHVVRFAEEPIIIHTEPTAS